jgi:hypothetical protein
MYRIFRLWGKKRGQRLTGWWMVGSLGEAAFFGGLCLLGLLTLTTVLVWQFVSPETQVYPIGFGFWVLILTSASFAGLGALGFALRILQVATSDEHRRALASRATRRLNPNATDRPAAPPMVPSLRGFTDSPGVKLAYRLPGGGPDVGLLVLSSLFALSWNALVVILVAILIGRWSSRIEWPLLVVLPLFVAVGVWAVRWFVGCFRQATGIGPTTVEIDRLPLRPGNSYRLYVAQYGRLELKKMEVVLVCEERATYHHGTDVRNEHQEIHRQLVHRQDQSQIDFGKPLEFECEMRVPRDAMHSFQSAHNAIQWKVVVEGESRRWLSFCRNFPVAVYPYEVNPSEGQLPRSAPTDGSSLPS